MPCLRSFAILLATAAIGLLSPGCESRPGRLPVSETASPIVGGNLATTCEWPTAIMLIGPLVGCSGTLVDPHVVVTAKHCLVDESGNPTPPTSIGLGETRDQWAMTAAVSQCFTHPSNDFGLCTLAEEVTGIPIVPVMAPCEMSELAAGQAIVEVGFGVTSATGSTYGAKKWIQGTIESAAADQVDIDVMTGSQDGEYYGDSGGPLFFQMPDSTWRLIGEDCCSPTISANDAAPRVSTYTSVPYHVAWAEQQSGVDLTPCHDASGWNPTAACTGFPTNPGDGVGTWSTVCQGETMLRRPTCQGMPLRTDAGGGQAEAGADTAGRGATTDGSADGGSRDFRGAGSEPDLDAEGDTGWAASDDAPSSIKDSGEVRDGTGSNEADVDAPDLDSSLASDSSANAGASGGNADGSGSESDGTAGAGGAASGGNDGGGDASAGRTSGQDGGSASDATAISDGDGSSGSISDGAADRKAPRMLDGGCACRSVSDRDAGFWPGLLGVALAAAHLIRRRPDNSHGNPGRVPNSSRDGPRRAKLAGSSRARSRGRFVV